MKRIGIMLLLTLCGVWQIQASLPEVTVYVVSTDRAQDAHKVAPLVRGNGWDFTVLLDPNGTLQRALNVKNVPHLFVIDSKGEIVYQHNAYLPGDEGEITGYLH